MSIKRLFSRAILLSNFSVLASLNKCDVWAKRIRQCISGSDFSSKLKSILIEFEFCAQTGKK